MTQSVTCTANVKWSISVPPDLDEATQIYLASHGGKKGALSALVQKAVSRYIIFSLNSRPYFKTPMPNGSSGGVRVSKVQTRSLPDA